MTGMIESKVAEVIWWVQAERNLTDDLATIQALSVGEQLQLAIDPTRIARYANNTPIRSLHRRALLVRPDLDEQLRSIRISSEEQLASFFNNNDISARVERLTDGTMRLRANSLADLTKRESRFAHLNTPPRSAGIGRVQAILRGI